MLVPRKNIARKFLARTCVCAYIDWCACVCACVCVCVYTHTRTLMQIYRAQGRFNVDVGQTTCHHYQGSRKEQVEGGVCCV